MNGSRRQNIPKMAFRLSLLAARVKKICLIFQHAFAAFKLSSVVSLQLFELSRV